MSSKRAKKSRRRRRPTGPRTDVLVDVVIDFQIVEAALKRYLEYAYLIIEILTKGTQPFKLGRTDVEDLPLGRLTDRFAKFVDDDTLVKELRALKGDRDHCAHRAFMDAYVEKGRVKVRDEYGRLLALRKRVRAAQKCLLEHVRHQRTLHGIVGLTHRIERGDFDRTSAGSQQAPSRAAAGSSSLDRKSRRPRSALTSDR